MTQNIREFTQFIVGKISLFILKIYWIFPIKNNRIFFTSYKGNQYSCNPKYIYEFLCEKENLELIWGFKNQVNEFDVKKKVKLHSIRGFYYCLTSKVVIDNFGFFPYIPYRTEQFCINTWHGGGAYKKIDNKTLHKSKFKVSLDRHKAKVTDLIVLACEEFKQVADSLLLGKEKIYAPIGMPRNDILFNQEKVLEKQKKIRNVLNLNEEFGIVLYAPTFRGSEKEKRSFEPQISFEKILRTLKVVYGKTFVILMREHNYLTGKMIVDKESIIDVSTYPDIMELICATDILITDYSSVMWDFALLGRPCFLFVPDLEQYRSDRNFYIDITEWKFPISTNMEELLSDIKKLSLDEAKKNAGEHLALFHSYEKGTACAQLWKMIRDVLEDT